MDGEEPSSDTVRKGKTIGMKILVTIPVEKRHRKRLEEIAPEADFFYRAAADVSREFAWDMDIIIGNVSPERIAGTKRLKWLQLNSAGTDGYLEKGVLPKGAALTNATGAYGLAISEHMLGMALGLKKKLYQYAKNQAEGIWRDEGDVTSIWGATTLVIGLGDIGGEFAMRMKALGSYVIGIRRTEAPKPAFADELYPLDRLEECLGRADIVAMSLPGTKETYRLMDRERLKRMKRDAILLNVGRGTAVDTEALCDALEQGWIGGAGLDVTDPEPLPPGHRLWKAPNLILTPHVSGQYHLKETHERILRIAMENLEAFLRGGKLKNVVDFQTGYRML